MDSRFCLNCGYAFTLKDKLHEEVFAQEAEDDYLEEPETSYSHEAPLQFQEPVRRSQSPPPVRPPLMALASSEYNRIVAAILAIFLGGLGAHKFYLGHPFQGILYIVLSVTGISAILGIVEGIRYLALSDEHFNEVTTR